MSFELNGYYKQVGEADISKELDCVNTLQKTQWRVNKYVLEVMEQCWNSGSKWEGLPAKDDLPLPAYPFAIEPSEMSEEQQVVFKEWKGQRAKIHEHNHITLSKLGEADICSTCSSTLVLPSTGPIGGCTVSSESGGKKEKLRGRTRKSYK